VSQGARADGLPASDGEVREYILKEIPFFQENGQFQRERYSLYLESTRTSAGDFEKKIRKEIENMRTRRLFETSAAPLGLELAKIQELKEHKMNVAFVRLSDEDMAKSIKVSDAEARQRLADPAFAKKAEDHFKAYEKDYSQEEEVRAQHILVQFKPGDAAAEKAALDKAVSLRAKAGKDDFGKLAKANSDDTGSKAKSGDLGFFGHGKMVKEFEDVAFTMKVGEISQPVKSPFGYHIIKLNERKEAKKADFDAVKVKVAQEMIAREKAGDVAKNIESLVEKGDQAGVEAALKSAGISWEETGYFDLSADAVPKVASQVVSEAVYDLTAAKPLLPKVLRDGGSKYVLKYAGSKTEAVAAAPKTETERELVGRRRGDGMYMSWLNGMREKARIETNKQVLQ
jgi:peptidyl-prolyl cis-trans isomerase D